MTKVTNPCRAWRATVLAVLGMIVSAGFACSDSPAQQPDAGDGAAALQLPTPTGPYGIARGPRRTLVDPVRDETVVLADGGLDDAASDAGLDDAASDAGDASTSEKRKISIEISYPTDLGATGTDAPYFDDADINALQVHGLNLLTSGVHVDLPYSAVRTHTKIGPPMVADQRRHPVLLFSAGYGWMPREYTSFIEELVSHGYVVVSVSHTYWDLVTVFADGSSTLGVLNFNNETDPQRDAEAVVWLGDLQLVLDTLSAIDANDTDGKLTGRLDLTHIGAFGHSFGGGAAINVCPRSARDGRHEPRRHDLRPRPCQRGRRDRLTIFPASLFASPGHDLGRDIRQRNGARLLPRARRRRPPELLGHRLAVRKQPPPRQFREHRSDTRGADHQRLPRRVLRPVPRRDDRATPGRPVTRLPGSLVISEAALREIFMNPRGSS